MGNLEVLIWIGGKYQHIHTFLESYYVYIVLLKWFVRLIQYVLYCYFSKSLFMREVYEKCYIQVPGKVESEIVDEILNQNVTAGNFIHIASKYLLRIIPNIILNKREEVIPLLISTVLLNPNHSERGKLLQQLFNLKKKPSEMERIMILCGELL